MELHPSLRKAVRSSLRRLIGNRALTRWFGGSGAVLTFHRVVPSPDLSKIAQNRRIEVTPEELETIIQWVIGQNFHPASLAELCSDIHSGSRRNLICFTFDDGYVDNLRYGLPVLERYSVPATIFVTTAMPDNDLKIWWYALESLLYQKEELRFAHGVKQYDLQTSSIASKAAAFSLLRQIIQNSSEEENNDLFAQLGMPDTTFRDLCSQLSLTWDQIRSLSAHPLVTIGAHTLSHRKLSNLSEAELRSELEGSKLRLEQETQRQVDFLAYPFGAADTCGPREFSFAQQAGFRAAFTTHPGNIFPAHAKQMWTLPRHNHTIGRSDFCIADLKSRIYASALARPTRWLAPIRRARLLSPVA